MAKKNLVPIRIPTLQYDWSVDLLLKELEALGIEVCLRVTKPENNEVHITISTTKDKKATRYLSFLLKRLYGIISD